ncbi:hypothetical protein [Stackebrandtia nassauensis]|uniref:Uncharacterized protein n=1 Tax=Stackebrandtia nassauensis (strain DSM 44728 / CIP 108903 / NRRL B-16338 / NBRC 102104 / LLR-40K-21) TaxID=446470 RepID=D3Q4A4_STANL|nr:hypothetical protein [Stackebrandtia nassauensis]ADD45989.1 hypothetical protein Snas_6373 [Stackebrandtia nassauensis DSM 44728]
MSWDVLLLRIPEGVTAIDQIPDDIPATPLGSRDDILAAISRVAPEANLSDPTWGQLNGEDWSMEFNIGSDDPVDSVMLHIRGGGDDMENVMFGVAGALNCQVIDCSGGDVLTPENGSSGWRAFQEYRDQVIGT